MPTPITLPKKKADLSQAIERLISDGESELQPHKVRFQMNQLYLQGIRDFRYINYRTGSVHIAHENHQGEINFRLEKLTKLFQDEVGRRLGMDVRPKVIRDGSHSLDGLRKTSTSQALLDSMIHEMSLPTVAAESIEIQLIHGSGALALWGQDETYDIETDTEGEEATVRAGVEVVPPWELLPIPAYTATPSGVRGIIRYRRVPLDWLKEREGLTPPKEGWKQLHTSDVSVGQEPNQINESTNATYKSSWATNDAPGKDTVSHVQLAEVFLEDWDGTLLRYCVWAGGFVLRDNDWSTRKPTTRPMMPIAKFSDIPTGNFFGNSFIDTLIGLNVELEHLLRNTFENFQDLDQFGYLMLPTSLGINVNDLRRKQAKPRYIEYESDITGGDKPFNIQPATIGDAPMRAAEAGLALMDQLAGQAGGMLGGDSPGRVDSASALNFLYETSNIPLSSPMLSLATAFGKVYSAALGLARSRMKKNTLARLVLLDDSLAGIVIDPKTGQPQLDANLVPHPTEVNITIKSTMPESKAKRKEELKEMLDRGLVTPLDFKVINFTEGLEFPIPEDSDWHAYRKAVLQNIILFGDGETPGELVITDYADDVHIQLKVLSSFMTRPEFMLASKEVRDKFRMRKQEYELSLGLGYPGQMPYGEDMAMGQMAGEQLQNGPPQTDAQALTSGAAARGF